MFRKIIFAVGLLVIGLFIVGPVFAHDETIIEVTEDGFTPNSVSIHTGDKVTFKNVSKEAVWPASDIHPSHSIYPEFDPKRGFPPGESWSFTLDKAGIWQFHDHLHPNTIGKITVAGGGAEPSPEPVELKKLNFKTRLKIFFTKLYLKVYPKGTEKVLSKVDMYSAAKTDDEIRYWLEVVGPKEVMVDIIKDTNGGSLFDCHQEAHRIGRVAYEVFGGEVFSKGDSACHSGFYHGAMEAFLKEKGTLNLGENIKTICKSFSTGFGQFECLHGVGHGLMAYLRYDLPQALKLCDQLETPYDQSSCYGGVFMENIVTALGLGAIPGHETNWLNNDPLFPCNATDQRNAVQVQCYLIQTARMMQLYQGDFTKISNACLGAPINMIPTCFQSLGRDLAGAVMRNPDSILKTCSIVPGQYYDNCLMGALYVVIEFWGERLQGQAYELCQKVPTKNSKDNCYTASFSRLNDIYGTNKAAKTASCALVEPDYKNTCNLVAGVN